jgi:hypothetical protein
MNPRTHPRGSRPDFTLPRPNPNSARMTDALWWLVCMREALEPALSENGGTYANKAGSHNVGANLPDHGEGNIRTDHSIRHPWNRAGPWWKTKCSAHDWTFLDAQHGDYRTINKYTRRLITAMADPRDLRPDEVVFYTLGNIDGDPVTEGYNELKDGPEYSGDTTHAWHRHDAYFRRIIGDFWAMWKVLTIDMGWTFTEWQQSVEENELTPDDRKWLSGEISRLVDVRADQSDAVTAALIRAAEARLKAEIDGVPRELFESTYGDPTHPGRRLRELFGDLAADRGYRTDADDFDEHSIPAGAPVRRWTAAADALLERFAAEDAAQQP